MLRNEILVCDSDNIESTWNPTLTRRAGELGLRRSGGERKEMAKWRSGEGEGIYEWEEFA